MELFRNAQEVRLWGFPDRFPRLYLVAKDDEETVSLEENEYAHGAYWSVEFVLNSDSVLRLKSCYGKYLAASYEPSLLGMTGYKVLQSLPSLVDSSSLELEPVMEGTHVKLRTHYGTFLGADDFHSVTHDFPHHTTILWDVKVLKRAEEGSATNIVDKASEKGSATKRHHKTGEGSSVTKSPPGDSGPIREGDRVRYSHLFLKLKVLILDDSGRKDVLVRGGTGMTALVREVCADFRKHFGTIVWISIPQKSDSELIHEEILLQLIFERAAFHENYDKNPWMLWNHEFDLQQKERCLIVVDNLEDPRTWKEFEEVLRIVGTCRVIFIARCERGSSYSQIYQYGREFETFELEDLSHVPRPYHLKDSLEEDFPSRLKGLCQLIVRKCETLPKAIVFVLRQIEHWPCHSSEIKYEWEAKIPSENLCGELRFIQQVLKTLYKDKGHELDKDKGHELDKDKGHELNHIQQVLQILCEDDRLFCFLYLSIFPENSLLSCKRVSRLWAAEGFLPDLEKAGSFFDDLLWRKCIHPVEKRSDGELSTFQLDERVREIISNWPEGLLYLSIRVTIWALNEQKSFQRFSRAVLHVSSNEGKTTTSEALRLETSKTPLFLFNLKHSKVLDLTGASDPPLRIVQDALSKLTDLSLRYLSLSNTSIEVIPTFVEKFMHLEFLDAKHSLITELPQQFATLKKIRHILIYHHEKDPLMETYNLIGFKASCRVGGFLCLEKLCFVEADEGTLEDMGNLTKLRRLGITKLRKEHGELLCTSLEKLEELRSLNIHAVEEDEIIDLRYLSSPPKNLRRLYLHGRLEKLPDWISSLNDLTKIILRWSHLEEDLLAALGKLPNLLELELRQAYDGEQLDFKNGQFWKLKILLLDELELRSMNLEKGTMPSLENLTISRCQWLERIPSGIEHVPAIRKLTFFDMSHKFYKKVREEHEKDDYQNFKHIPEVYFTRWRAGHWEPHQVGSADEAHQEKAKPIVPIWRKALMGSVFKNST